MTRLLLLALAACVAAPDESEIERALTAAQWQPDVRIYGQYTSRQVALAYYGDRLHMVHVGSNGDPTQLYWSKFDGADWTTNVPITGTSSREPGLVVFGGVMRLFFRATNGSGNIVHTRFNGTAWSTPIVGTRSMGSGPSPTVHDNRLLIGYCTPGISGNPSQGVTILDYRLGAYETFLELATPNGDECKHVTIASFNGKLHIIASLKEPDGQFPWEKGDWYMYEWTRSSSLNVADRLPMSTRRPMSTVVCDGRLHLVHSGNSTTTEIWWSFRSLTSTRWRADERIPDQSSHSGGALGCFDNTTPILVHNGYSDDVLWWSQFLE